MVIGEQFAPPMVPDLGGAPGRPDEVREEQRHEDPGGIGLPSARRAEPLFEKLKAEYDFIVVDSHPVLAATDSLLIGQSVDAVLLSILQEVSQSPRVYAASQKLAALGIRVVGAVVNGASREDLYSGGYQCVPEPVR